MAKNVVDRKCGRYDFCEASRSRKPIRKLACKRMSIREPTEGLKRMLPLLVFAQDNLAISYTMGILGCRNSIERIVYSPANF